MADRDPDRRRQPEQPEQSGQSEQPEQPEQPRLPTMRYTWILLILVVTAALGWLAAYVSAARSWPVPVLGLTSVITMTAVVILLLVLGIRVLRDRHKPVAARMNPLAAARTMVLAQAGAYAGAVIAGWHLGLLVHRVPVAGWDSVSSLDAVVMMFTAVALSVVGCVVEQWCRIPPDEDGSDSSRGERGRGPAAPRPDDGIPQAGRNRL